MKRSASSGPPPLPCAPGSQRWPVRCRQAVILLAYRVQVDAQAGGQLADSHGDAAGAEVVAPLDHAGDLAVPEEALDLPLLGGVALLDLAGHGGEEALLWLLEGRWLRRCRPGRCGRPAGRPRPRGQDAPAPRWRPARRPPRRPPPGAWPHSRRGTPRPHGRWPGRSGCRRKSSRRRRWWPACAGAACPPWSVIGARGSPHPVRRRA